MIKIFGAFQLYHFISIFILAFVQIVSSTIGGHTFFNLGLAITKQQEKQWETINLSAKSEPVSFYLIFDRSASMVRETETGRPLEVGRQITQFFIKEVLQEGDNFGFLILEDNVPQQSIHLEPVGFDRNLLMNKITPELGYDEVDESNPCILYQAIHTTISTLKTEQNSAIIIITDGDKKRAKSCSQPERDLVAMRTQEQQIPLFMFLIGDGFFEEEKAMASQSKGRLISIPLSGKLWDANGEDPSRTVVELFKILEEIRPDQFKNEVFAEPSLQFQTGDEDITLLSANEWVFNVSAQNIDDEDNLVVFVNDQPIQDFTPNLKEGKLTILFEQPPIINDGEGRSDLLEIRVGQQSLDKILIAQNNGSFVLEDLLPKTVLNAARDTPISMMSLIVGISGLILVTIAYRVYHKPRPQPSIPDLIHHSGTKTRMPPDLMELDFRSAHLIYVRGAEHEDTPIKFSPLKIEKAVVKIGRCEEDPEPSSSGEVYINLRGETTVSRPVHAEITFNRVEQRFYIVDRSSAITIIRVSGNIIEKGKLEPLFHNTLIQIGGLEFRFEFDEEFRRNVPPHDDGNEITRPLEDPNQ